MDMNEEEIHIEKIQPPEMLVTDEDHDDRFAVFIRDCINTFSEKFITEGQTSHELDLKEEHKDKVLWYHDINTGYCEGLVAFVLDAVVDSEFDHTKVESHGRLQENGDVTHFWIQYETPEGESYHFDAEAPWGVKNWKALPSIREQLPFVIQNTKHVCEDPRKIDFITVRGFCYKGFE